MHQAIGGAHGEATSVEIAARQLIRVQETIRKIISKHTGQPLEKVVRDTDRDIWLGTQEALEYGLIDEILTGPAYQEQKE